MELELPYGRVPMRLTADARHIEVIRAPELPVPRPVEELVARALEAPIGAPPLATYAARRVTVIISDSTRAEPRAAFLAAVRRELPDAQWTIAIATGTHGPCSLEELGLSPDLVRGATIVNHDGHASRDLVTLGTTSRGTPVRLHRCVVDAELVIATGCIRPHYFAGFGAGVKAIFPGLGEAIAIRINHRLKTDPHARAGIVRGNPCRDDLVDAVAKVQTPMFLVNGVCGPDGAVHAVVAGDLGTAFAIGAEQARPWFTVRARPADLVIASDALPVTASLYQAAKIAAAVAPWVNPDGRLVIVAECFDGVGPVETVNEAILKLGIVPRLQVGVRLQLVSSLQDAVVSQTVVEPVPAIPAIDRRTLVVPHASQLICEAL
jgi:lactate racemase